MERTARINEDRRKTAQKRIESRKGAILADLNSLKYTFGEICIRHQVSKNTLRPAVNEWGYDIEAWKERRRDRVSRDLAEQKRAQKDLAGSCVNWLTVAW